VYFDAFSSKNRYGTTFTSDYDQGCFIVFECCSFTGKERDSETGYGYFGARYMDHELMTMWLSVDPMADKYPSISPYAYCAWNPVKLVDPDGNEIHISIPISLKDGVKIVDYYYHYDFKSHKSSWMDREGNALNYDNISVDVAAEFVEELTSSLELLLSKPVGKWLVGTIMRDDKKDILIGQSPYNFANENGEGIGFNPTRKSKIETNGCKTNPAFIGLGHELAHIFDNWYGDFQKTCKEVWFRYPESYNVSVEFTSNAEKYACMIENLLRFEHNLDQREYYFSHKNSNMGKCITF
jgi:RHS repeat-associated protein